MEIVNSRFQIILRFFIPYTIILIISVCTGIVLYNKMIKIVENEIMNANMMVLEQGKNIMDKEMYDIDKNIYEIMSDSKIKNLKFLKEPFYGSNIMRVLDSKKQMENYKNDSELIIDSYILIKNSNLVLNFDSIYKIPEFYSNFIKYNTMNYNTWYSKILNQYRQKYCLPAEQITLKEKRYTAITYINSIGYSFMTQGAILYILNSDYILDLFKGLDINDGGWIYVEDDQGQMICSFTSKTGNIQPTIIDTNDKRGAFQYSYKGQEMMVTYTTSSYNSWKYVVVQPTRIVKAKVLVLKQVSLLILFLYLILGIIVAYLLAYRNSKPIQEIWEVIKRRINGEKKSHSIYGMLKNTITSLIDNNKELETRIEAQIPFLKNAFFESLFKGEFDSEEEIKYLTRHIGLSLDAEYYVVFILQLYIGKNQSNGSILEEYDLQRLAIQDILMELCSKNIFLHHSKTDRIIVLYNLEYNDKDACVKILESNIEKIINKINSQLNIDITIGVGEIYPNLMDIRRSYDEANQALSLSAWEKDKKNKRIVWYTDINYGKKSYYLPADVEIRLINYVSSGNKQMIKKIFNELYEENFIVRPLPLYSIQFFICSMYGILLAVMEKLSIQDEDIWESAMMVFQETHQDKEKMSDLYFEILEYYYRISDVIDKRKKSHNESLIIQIKDFIEKCYEDSGFNLPAVADHFNMSQTYVSQFFKEHVGITFSEYLEEVRMNKAKELLCDGDLSISSIAKSVGYSSVSTFSRAFKRKYNISARDYRAAQKSF